MQVNLNRDDGLKLVNYLNIFLIIYLFNLQRNINVF